MKTFTSLLLLLSIPTFLFSQFDFAPIGAKWTFNKCNIFYCAFEQLEVIRDTSINTMDCRVLKRTLTYLDGTVENKGEHFFCNEESKVYHHFDSILYLLYDFEAQVGDSWPIKLLDHGLHEISDVEAILTIDSIGSINSGGESFVTQYVSLEYSEDLAYATGWSIYEIISGIGSSRYILPTFFLESIGDIYVLFCYEDSIKSYNYPFLDPGFDCSMLPVSTIETEEKSIIIYPNPAYDRLKIQLSPFSQYQNTKISDIELFNITGQSVGTIPIIKSESEIELNVSTIPKGIYWLRLLVEGYYIIEKIIIH